MITNLFKNNFLSYVIISVLAIFLWGIAYFSITLDWPEEVNIGNHSFTVSRQNSILISLFITLLGGALLNYRIKKYVLSYDPNNLFFLFYILLISTQLLNHNLLVYSVVSLLIVFLINYLLFFIENKSSEKQVFNASLLLGVLIFHNPILGFFLFILIQNLSAIRRIAIKEIILMVVGIGLPIAYVFMISSLVGNTEIGLTEIIMEFEFPKINLKYASVLCLLIFIAITGFRIVINKRSGTDINILRLTKNLFAFFLASVLISFGSLFLFPQGYAVFILAAPLSIFLGFYFANSNYKWKELLFIVCLATMFLLR